MGLNSVLLVVAPAPAIVFSAYCRGEGCHVGSYQQGWLGRVLFGLNCCNWHYHPVVTVNQLLFWNLCVLFWIVSLIQKSTWLIDPYWTAVPVLVEAYYTLHPSASSSARSRTAFVLILIWSLRLTHSYFRRENWQLGQREDWRFADLRKQHGRHFWWTSFLVAYLSQHAMLLGLTLPLYSTSFSHTPWLWQCDGPAALLCITGESEILLHALLAGMMLPLGCNSSKASLAVWPHCCHGLPRMHFIGLLIASAADTSLDTFVKANERRQAQGQPKHQLLKSGLWRYSRHPNHFGEQLFWWGLALFAVSSGDYWTLIGPLFNTVCMVQVTKLVEARMLQQPARAAAFQQYQQTTSIWFLWWPQNQSYTS